MAARPGLTFFEMLQSGIENFFDPVKLGAPGFLNVVETLVELAIEFIESPVDLIEPAINLVKPRLHMGP
jgi:hypothetical protein